MDKRRAERKTSMGQHLKKYVWFALLLCCLYVALLLRQMHILFVTLLLLIFLESQRVIFTSVLFFVHLNTAFIHIQGFLYVYVTRRYKRDYVDNQQKVKTTKEIAQLRKYSIFFCVYVCVYGRVLKICFAFSLHSNHIHQHLHIQIHIVPSIISMLAYIYTYTKTNRPATKNILVTIHICYQI